MLLVHLETSRYLLVVVIVLLLQSACDCVSVGFLSVGKLSIEVRGDGRGLPVIDQTASSNGVACCDQWSHDGWEMLDTFEAAFTSALLDVTSNVSQVWALRNETGELSSPAGPKNKGSKVCATVLVRLPENSTLSVFARLPDGAHETRLLEIKGTKHNSWTVRRITRNGHRSFRGKQLQLVLRGNQLQSDDFILIQWASFCSVDEEANTYSFPSNFTADNATSVFPSVVLTPSVRGLVPDAVCLNGGRLNLDYSMCDCPPGFTGDVCERGCGQNSFGARCEGRCSESVSRNCRGVFICSRHGGCSCVAGLEGDKCDVHCRDGLYGADCKRQCGQCAGGEPCDRFTGQCLKGCDGSRQPPFCNNECGRSPTSASLISYAEDAAAEDFPWHTAVYLRQKRSEPLYKCGGSLVRPAYVVSAAHCFYMKTNRGERYAVGLGKTYNEWDAEERYMERSQFRDVASIHFPEAYRGHLRSYSNDIALLRLERAVDVTPYVMPICFDWSGGYEVELEDGDLGTVVGWGATHNSSTSHTLQKADLPYVAFQDCLDELPDTFQAYTTEDKFCAGKRGDTVVNRGDSGGGFLVLQGASWFLRGIVSVGLPEQTPYTVYTNVSLFRNWLVETWNQLDIDGAMDTRP